MKSILVTLLCFWCLLSCTEGDDYHLEDMVDGDLLVFFQRFEAEALSRDFEIIWSEEGINARLVDIKEDAVGQCLKYSEGQRQINIDKSYWFRIGDLEKEFLIFHELGHCLLDRTHLDEADRDGICVSMMNSGEGLCKKNYRSNTRKEYLDELFF